MMNMEAKAMSIVKEYEGLMADVMSGFGLDQMLEMNEADFNVTKRALRLCKDSMELMVMQAKSLDEANSKLDKIIKMLEEKES